MSPNNAKPLTERLREWASKLKCDVQALYLAARDPRVPWYAKAVALSVAAYALSPIDLIPDFIPVIGHLDDLIIVPFGIWLAVRLIPEDILNEHRATARRKAEGPKKEVNTEEALPARSPEQAGRSASHSAGSQQPSPSARKAPWPASSYRS